MKDFDLESKIRNMRVPQRGDEYWEAFPDRVLAELRATPAPMRTARQSFMPNFLFGARLALTCLGLVFCLWQSGMPRTLSHALRKDETELRQSMVRFDNGLDRFMQDEHGLGWLINDQP